MAEEKEAKVLEVHLVETIVWVIKFPRKSNKVRKECIPFLTILISYKALLIKVEIV